MYCLISYWLTYFIVGYLLDDAKKHKVPPYQLYGLLLINVFCSLLIYFLIPIYEPFIQLPNYCYSYLIRWISILMISDICNYLMHRLFHTKFLYSYHKIHHLYQEPHALSGLYVHPLEFILSNYLSMILPMLLFSHQEMMIIEHIGVALDIVISHTQMDHPSANYHRLHHLYKKYNYGFFYFSDYIFGTLS